jgi:hypothetical protein
MTTSTLNIADICLYFLGYGTNLKPDQKQRHLETWGFKGKCVKLLAKLLGVSVSYVWHWGKGWDFAKMPQAQMDKLTILFLQHRLSEQEDLIQKQQAIINRLSARSTVRLAS